MTTMTEQRLKLTPESFQPATAQSARGMTFLVYGPPGVGKTTLAAGGPAPLVIDLDGGTYSLAHRADVQVFRPATWDNLPALYTYLRGAHPFKTVVFDSITEAYRLALARAQADDPRAVAGAGPQLQHHGAATERLVNLVRAFVGLADTGLHVVFTAPEIVKADLQEGRDDKGPLIRRPALPPKAWEGVQAAVDHIVRLAPASGGRRLHLRSRSSFVAAKFRAPGGLEIPESLDNPTFNDLLKLLGKDK